jgi:hypothetical protein
LVRRKHHYSAAREKSVSLTLEDPSASCSSSSWRDVSAQLTKARILELYLNVISGVMVYGAEAAARAYFHTSPSNVGPSESGTARSGYRQSERLNPGRPTARPSAVNS